MQALKKVAAAAQQKIEEKHPGLIEQTVNQAYSLKQAVKEATPRRFVCEQLGYPMEKYQYWTKDGYINTVFRIPGPKGTQEGLGAQGKPVVLYQHGLFDCFAGILCDEEESLGLRLVNQGFDLWMGNARCNRYSRDHQWIEVDTSQSSVRSKYWEISFDHMAAYDQPALWDFILGQTKQAQLTYIGHSQGTTQMFAAMSHFGDFFRPKMKGCILIAPVTRVQNMLSPWCQKMKADQKAFDFFQSQGPEIMKNAAAATVTGQVTAKLTAGVSDLITANGSDADPTKISKIGAFNNNKFFPSGSCFRQVHHFHQLLNNGGFRKFDFGSKEANMENYGQETPPEYNLGDVNGFNITLVCGTNDLMASPGDYTWTRDQLKDKNKVEFWEYELGHTSLVTPVDKTHITHMFDQVVKLNA